MQKAFRLLGVVALVAAGCMAMDDGPGFSTPEACLKVLFEGFSSRSEATPERILPTDDLLRAHFECPADELVKRRQERFTRWPKELARAPAGMKFELVEILDPQVDVTRLDMDAEHLGCRVKQPVTLRTVKAMIRTTTDGESEQHDDRYDFIKFGDAERWYFFKL